MQWWPIIPLGIGIDVLGKDALVYLQPVDNGAGATVDVKIQESDDDVTYTDWSGGAFTQVTEANDTAIQEIEYTGVKQYVRAVAKTLVDACTFGVTVLAQGSTSIEDDLLTAILQASREHVEDVTRRALLTQTWDYYLDAFPAGDEIKLPFGNLQSVTHVKYTDSDGDETTLTADTDYTVETNGEQCGFIKLPYDGSWPSATLGPSKPINIRFVCGWTAAASIPAKIRAAIKMICHDLYENRESQVFAGSGMDYQENVTVSRLLASARLLDEF